VNAEASAPGDVVRVRAVVAGRVQGVWFRESCRGEADRLGVAGWVHNLPDGRVEIEAQGEQAAVDALVAWARRGPRLAIVESVTVDPLAVEAEPSNVRPGFAVRRPRRPTAPPPSR
jgi:acylphosphatase